MPHEAKLETARSYLSALQDPLLVLLLEKAVNTDPQLERLLPRVRRALLSEALAGRLREVLGDGGAQFLCALAQQCFLNEYVYDETVEESAEVERLFELIDRDLRHHLEVDGVALARLGTYRPLWKLPFAPQIFRYYEPTGSNVLYKVLRMQLIGPTVEKGLRQEIRQVTAITDPVSRAVRRQYEENPYPRWLFMDYHTARGVGTYIGDVLPHLHRREVDWPTAPRVLVAGCGTGKQAISAAMRYAGSSVDAVDLSLASLAYGMRMAMELNVGNIEFVQGDILELESYARAYDVIECVGVLHHMRDPKAGWKILHGLLEPGGLMRIGLYSRTARRAVALARELAVTLGLEPTQEGIRAFRRHVLALAQDQPLAALQHWADFYTTSECRDLAFHVQERDFTLVDIEVCLDELGLEFLGFEFADDTPLERYLQRFADDPDATSLANWQRFENGAPETFASMYQLWALKH